MLHVIPEKKRFTMKLIFDNFSRSVKYQGNVEQIVEELPSIGEVPSSSGKLVQYSIEVKQKI